MPNWLKIALAVIVLALFYRLRHPGAPSLHTKEQPLRPLANLQVDWTKQFPERFPMQVAVLWTAPEERGLGLIHPLQQMGIPFFVTRDLTQALKHPLLIVYPSIDGRTFDAGQIAQIHRYVEAGHTLWSQHVSAGGFKEICGFEGLVAKRNRYKVEFKPTLDKAMALLDRPEERTIQLGNPQLSEIIWSDGYRPGPGTTVLARYEDGSAALTRHQLGKGQAYLCGLGLDDVVARPEADRDFEAERHYCNEFEPGADVFRLILRGWYESHSSGWLRLGTHPNGLRSTMIISHDVDWEYSVKKCIDFEAAENAHHVKSTFLMQTKYLNDTNSRAFFYGKSLDYVRQLKRDGFDLGSHSVIHAMGFNKFPTGTGEETFATYRARTQGEEFPGGTVYGEVRVSKSILDGEIPGQDTVIFRAGHLRFPPALPQALERCGYEFDSSFTGDDTMTSFPYRLTRDLDFTTEADIYEFPVTIEDEESPLASRIPRALEVIRANADNGGMSVLLLHTNDPETKIPAENALIESLPHTIGVSDMMDYARFWKGRDHLVWSLQGSTLKLQAPEPVHGITFESEKPLKAVSAPAKLFDATHVVIPTLTKGQSLSIRLTYR